MKNHVLHLIMTVLSLALPESHSLENDSHFECPEEFGYYQHPHDCSKYYVCVFGGPLQESCTGGLMYSHELQTCDWPRNVVCHAGKRNGDVDNDRGRVPRLLVEDVNAAPGFNFGQKNNIPTSTTKKVPTTTSEAATELTPPVPTPGDETERSFSSRNYDDVDVVFEEDDDEKEDLLTAKSTELLHSPPVYESDVDVEHDFYDYEVNDNDDDDFYYVSWEDPIYDVFQEYDYSGSSERRRRVTGNNVTIDYSSFPQRPPLRYPELQLVRPGAQAINCKSKHCRLPDCLCGKTHLKELKGVRKIPQLVILTFDDSVNDLNRHLYKDIFKDYRRNPNGCPISSTFYVSHEWTDYSQVQNLYAAGHEIASHSISHSYGEQFSKTKWMREIVGQRELLSAFSGIPLEDIRGMRAPFLAIGGDNMFEMMYEANFTYDSSMPIYENKPPPFPYTMDYKMPHDCMIPPCPERSYPGLWEIPLVMWNDLGNGRCSMLDACSNPSNADDVYKLLFQNFARHYNSNRAPIGLFYHAAWFTQPHNREGFERFVDTVLSQDDVWFVTSWQAIQWMRSLPDLVDPHDFEPFQCNQKKRQNPCRKPKVCNLWHKSGVRYMRTCQDCPPNYPWTGNTGISNSLADTL